MLLSVHRRTNMAHMKWTGVSTRRSFAMNGYLGSGSRRRCFHYCSPCRQFWTEMRNVEIWQLRSTRNSEKNRARSQRHLNWNENDEKKWNDGRICISDYTDESLHLGSNPPFVQRAPLLSDCGTEFIVTPGTTSLRSIRKCCAIVSQRMSRVELLSIKSASLTLTKPCCRDPSSSFNWQIRRWTSARRP